MKICFSVSSNFICKQLLVSVQLFIPLFMEMKCSAQFITAFFPDNCQIRQQKTTDIRTRLLRLFKSSSLRKWCKVENENF